MGHNEQRATLTKLQNPPSHANKQARDTKDDHNRGTTNARRAESHIVSSSGLLLGGIGFGVAEWSYLGFSPAITNLISPALGFAIAANGARRLVEGKVNTSKSSTRWRLCASIISFTLALIATLRIEWFKDNFDSRKFWEGCDGIPCAREPKKTSTIAYAVECGMYIEALFTFVLLKSKKHIKKDFVVMVLHHSVAICLIAYSFRLALLDVGLVVLSTHDLCDIFLECAKLSRYSGNNALLNTFFAIFVLLWVSLRLVTFPTHVIRSVYSVAPRVIKEENGMELEEVQPHWIIFLGLLVTIAVCNVIWSVFIARIIVSALKTEEEGGKASIDDNRSDDEHDG